MADDCRRAEQLSQGPPRGRSRQTPSRSPPVIASGIHRFPCLRSDQGVTYHSFAADGLDSWETSTHPSECEGRQTNFKVSICDRITTFFRARELVTHGLEEPEERTEVAYCCICMVECVCYHSITPYPRWNTEAVECRVLWPLCLIMETWN